MTLRYVTAAEIVALYGCKPAEVYRLANEHDWHRVRDGRRQALYAADDVLATFVKLVKVKPPARPA